MDGKTLKNSYYRAGEDFLAFRLEKMFRVIRTEADIALHNDMLSEVLLMIDDKPDEFFRGLAHKILNREKKAKKSFLSMISEQLISIPNKKG